MGSWVIFPDFLVIKHTCFILSNNTPVLLMADFNRCISDSSNSWSTSSLTPSLPVILSLTLIRSCLDSFITSISNILVFHSCILSFQNFLFIIRAFKRPMIFLIHTPYKHPPLSYSSLIASLIWQIHNPDSLSLLHVCNSEAKTVWRKTDATLTWS